MTAFEISLLIINQKMYEAGMIDECTKEKIENEILNNCDTKDIIYLDRVS